MKMIKLVLIFMFYLFPLLVMAQVISIKPFDDGKELYFKAQDLFRNGKITEGSAVKDKAINKFKYAQKLVKEEKFKKEIQVWIEKCDKLSSKSVGSSTSAALSKNWLISWNEDDKCILLRSGRQIVYYKMIPVEGGTYGEGETIMNFSIGETEVTVLLWNVVMNGGVAAMNLKPKTNVSWKECNEFIEKLNEKTGKLFRLPEKNEWEFAASGGNKTNGYEYAGSNDLSQITNLDAKLQSVKKYKANELGLYDMTGNAYEWTSTSHEVGGYILKGGSFREANINGYLNKKKLKISDSEHFPENDKQDRFGFRIVKSYE